MWLEFQAGLLGVVLAAFRLFLAIVAVTGMLAGPSQGAETVTYAQHTTVVKGLRLTVFTKPTDDSGALRIASAKNALWFAETGTGKIVKMSKSGTATLFPIPIAGTTVHAITKGPDGFAWFATFNKGFIGRVTPTGTFKSFNTGLAANNSNDIITGPDGRLWYATDFNGIGRMTVTGANSLKPIVTNADQPTALTTGPDNRVWYVEWTGDNVGRMSTGGAVNEYPAGFASFSNSFGIAKGADNRIWFCDPQRNRIGRINANGTGLKYFTSGLTGSPDSIIAGPDGNLYFGEFQSKIGRITTAGVITEYAIPNGGKSFPVLGLTIGPDNNIWFTNNEHAQIGRLRLAPP